MADSNQTSIEYASVRETIDEIRNQYLPKMKGIFEEFNSSMHTLGGEDVFVGDASQTFQSEYNQLKARFNEFEDMISRFATQFENAATSTEQTERSIAQEAQNLNGGN